LSPLGKTVTGNRFRKSGEINRLPPLCGVYVVRIFESFFSALDYQDFSR